MEASPRKHGARCFGQAGAKQKNGGGVNIAEREVIADGMIRSITLDERQMLNLLLTAFLNPKETYQSPEPTTWLHPAVARLER
jgi:hypothetical protein